MSNLIPKYQTAHSPILPISAFRSKKSSADARSDHQKSRQQVQQEHQAAQAQRVKVAQEKAESRNKRNERQHTTVKTNFEGEPVTETDYNANNLGQGLETTGPEKWLLEYQLSKPLFEGVPLLAKKLNSAPLRKFNEYIKFDDYDLANKYSSLKLNKRFQPNPQVVGGPNGTPMQTLGKMHPTGFSHAYAKEMERRMKNFGINPGGDLMWDSVNKRAVSFADKIQQEANTPTTVVADKGLSAGWYNTRTGNRYVNIAHSPDIASTEFHEGVMHATDDVAELSSPRNVSFYELQDIANDIDNLGYTSASESSKKWYELRATLGEAIRNMYKGISKATGQGVDIEGMRPIFEKTVDKMPSTQLGDMLGDISAYGTDYQNFLKDNPQYTDRFRWLLKNMVVTAPAATLLLKTNENKSR